MFVMNAFSVKAEIDDVIYDSAIESLLEFIKDVSPLVRVQAVNALQRLQEPGNQDDVVVKAYTYHLEFDPSPKVRQAILTSIGKNFAVIPAIIDRLHDVDEKVRRHVYIQMSSYNVKQYRIAQRLSFLENGLYDRSDLVRKVVINIMLPNWIEAYDNKYDQFVSAIKIDSNNEHLLRFRKIAGLALEEIFK
jgi:condensin complex subunit 3